MSDVTIFTYHLNFNRNNFSNESLLFNFNDVILGKFFNW